MNSDKDFRRALQGLETSFGLSGGASENANGEADYPAELNEPIRIPKRPDPKPSLRDSTVDSDQHRSEVIRWLPKSALMVGTERVKKLDLLLDHFGISKTHPDRWKWLTYRLAKKHVQGFEVAVENLGGAPVEWDIKLKLKLYRTVREVQAEKRGCTENRAFSILAGREPWKGLGKTERALEAAFRTVKDLPIIKGLEKMRRDPLLFDLIEKQGRDPEIVVDQIIYGYFLTGLNQFYTLEKDHAR